MNEVPTYDEVRATNMLVQLILEFGKLDQSKRTELTQSTRVAIHGSKIEVRFDYLGERSWYEWDGTRRGLERVIRTAAGSLAKTLHMERKAHGPTPWDRPA